MIIYREALLCSTVVVSTVYFFNRIWTHRCYFGRISVPSPRSVHGTVTATEHKHNIEISTTTLSFRLHEITRNSASV